MSETPALLSACALLQAYRDGRLSPVEATEAALRAIERHDPIFNAFTLVDRDGALAAARESERRWQAGAPRGRLDGVPATIKEIVLTRGWPTRRGSRAIDAEGPWDSDAPAVARLREHGAVLLGTTTTPEFGWKGVTDSPLTGITRNPWNADCTPGGSSGGAAVAAATGMGALHLGSDGGGSIRMPCGFTGVVGIKPSFGRVPAYPLSPFGTLAHVGPMARTVGDCALMLTVMAEPDARDPYALPYDGTDFGAGLEGGVEGLRIAYSPDFGGQAVDPEIAELVADAAHSFAELGAVVEQPQLDPPATRDVFETLWFAGAARLLDGYDDARQALMDPGLREIASAGAGITLLDYLAAVAARESFAVFMNRLHQDYDLLLLPCLPLTAFAAGREFPEGRVCRRWFDWSPFTYPFNLTGQPAISLPCGLTGDGLPAALQLVGPRFADGLVLRAARAFEAVRPAQLPPVVADGAP